MSLLHADAWPLLLLAPLVGVSLWALGRVRARRLRHAVGERAPILGDVSVARRRLSGWVFSTAVLLALLSMLQPLWGNSVEQRGIDIVVALDVSRSMLARDVAPNRLARAQRELAALADRAAGDRFGLVLFAGDARLVVPLTGDANSFREIVNLADPLSIGRGGTDLGAALETALDALGDRGGEHEVVLLLTDGEDLEGRGLQVAGTAKERKITVHCIGFGTARGAKIPIRTGNGETFLRDRAGNEVVSSMDPGTLRRIADATGGAFADAETPLVDLYEDRIVPMARETSAARSRGERESRYQWPLLGAFVLWIAGACLGRRRV